MSRILTILLFALFFAAPASAGSEFPLGDFQVINSGGFLQRDGIRQELEADRNIGTASLTRDPEGALSLAINGSTLRLFPLQNGLASLDWDAEGTALLHSDDIEAFLDGRTADAIPAWGADLIWPGSGDVRLVLFPLGVQAYTGFLISHPNEKTVVRQMEFRQVFGPGNRPHLSANSRNVAAK